MGGGLASEAPEIISPVRTAADLSEVDANSAVVHVFFLKEFTDTDNTVFLSTAFNIVTILSVKKCCWNRIKSFLRASAMLKHVIDISV